MDNVSHPRTRIAILGGGPGFVLAITGWWFTLWLWTPIYANILVVQFFAPLAYTMRAHRLRAIQDADRHLGSDGRTGRI